MISGTIRIPTGEYRFSSEYVSIEKDKKLYIDPSTWCIHGKYEVSSGKSIVSRSNVTAHLAQIHPFTLGWLADFHMFLWPNGWRAALIKQQVDRLALCNPTLTVFGGDIASGSGSYCAPICGDAVEKSSFENLWNYSKDKLSNNLWVKGNHDIDPGCYYYYDWFERLWSLKLGMFKFIGFDTYNEQLIVPETDRPYLSFTDIIWLKKRLNEDELGKIILTHFPLDQWYKDALWVFEEKSNIKCTLSGHLHDLFYAEVSNIPVYVNGTCRDKNIELNAATINTFMKDGSYVSIVIEGSIDVSSAHNRIQISTPIIVGWEKDNITAKVPIRLARNINNHYLNFILFCPSESTSILQITKKRNYKIKVISDVETYIIGKEIYSKDTSYDSWRCPCGKVWNSYYIEAKRSFELELTAKSLEKDRNYE